MMLVLVSFCIFVLALTVFYGWRRWKGYSVKFPPGPLNIPLLGSWEAAHLWLWGGNMTDMFQKMGDRYGPVFFFRIAMDTPVVVIRTYEALKEASHDLTLQSSNMQYFYQMSADWNNFGVSLSEGKVHSAHRRFLIKHLGQLGYRNETWHDTVRYECTKAVDHLLSAKGELINIRDCMGLSNNSTLQITMGVRLDVGEQRYRDLHRNVDVALRGVAKLYSWLDFCPWLSYVAPGLTFYSEMKAGLDGLYAEIDAAIAKHREEYNPGEEPRDAIDAYLASTPESEYCWADLRVFIKDMIVGGYDSTGVLLGWAMMLLADRMDVQNKVQAEVDTFIGQDRSPTEADEKDCAYTGAVIDEVIRYVTLVPFTRHFTTYGSTTLRGYHIPQGSIVLTDMHSVHHDPDVWGDPDVFRPERFLGPDGARLRDRVRGFGFTQRVCPAERYSRVLMFLFLTGVLQKVRITLPKGASVGADSVYSVEVFPANPMVIAEQRT